jgi:cytochrome d ubiquinol oxidase subunit II
LAACRRRRTFAAFPEWYATLFSGFYLPLLLILRRADRARRRVRVPRQAHDDRWRAGWDRAIVVGSFVPALLWGVAFANIVRGVPIDADKEYVGGFFNLLNPYALLGGLTTLLLFLTHGAMFLALKTDGRSAAGPATSAFKVGLAAAVVAVGSCWTQVMTGDVGSAVVFVLAALALVGRLAAVLRGREGWGFLGTFVAIAVAVAGCSRAVPRRRCRRHCPRRSPDDHNARATHYTLTIMTVVA